MAAGVAQAQEHREHYRAGMDAMQAQRWTDAIPHLRKAIEVRPRENKGTFRRYVPYFQLGLAYYRLDNCATALELWAESKRQRVIQTVPEEWATLQTAEINCQKRALGASLEGDIDEVTVARNVVDELRKSGAERLMAAGSPSWSQRYRAAQQQLEAAVAVRDRRGARADEVSRARQLAAEALNGFRDIEAGLREGMRSQQADRQAKRAELDQVVADAERVLGTLPALDPFPRNLGGLRDGVSRLLEEVRGGQSGSVIDLSRQLIDLQDAVVKLQRAAAGPPTKLVEAADAFMSRDYRTVVDGFEASSLRTDRARSHGRLLRAAALFALYVEGHEIDSELLQNAVSEVRACRARSAELTPNEQMFSPRFVRWFHEVLAQPVDGPTPLARHR